MRVLDAWAVMALLKAEQPAAERVRALFKAAECGEQKLLMNILNIGEVFYISVKARDAGYGQGVVNSLRSVLRVVSATDPLVMAAAVLKSRYPISYATAFAAATALAHDATLVTGDPELRAVAGEEMKLKLEWIGGE